MHHPPPIVEENSAGSEVNIVFKTPKAGHDETTVEYRQDTSGPIVTVGSGLGMSAAMLSSNEQSRKRAFSLGNMNVVPR